MASLLMDIHASARSKDQTTAARQENPGLAGAPEVCERETWDFTAKSVGNFVRMHMSVGNKLTWFLLLGVLVVTGLDLSLSLQRTRENLLEELRHEVAAISRTLQVTLDIAGDDAPWRYFDRLATSISSFENILGLVFYDQEGQPVTMSTSLRTHRLPKVDVRMVIRTRTPEEGMFSEDGAQRYYRIEPISSSSGTGIGAFLVLEDFPIFTREFRGRTVQMLLNTLMLLVVLSLIVSLTIRQYVSRPLRFVARHMKTVGQGHFSQRLHLRRQDEIGELAEEFDRMCIRLDDAQRTLLAETEEKLRLERALRHSEKLAAFGQLASRLAHEIGTPLNVIQMRAEQLLKRDAQNERDQHLLNVIVAQIERISRFVRQLLTLARRPEFQPRAVSLNDIVRRVWETIGDQENPSGITVRLDLTEPLPLVQGDPDQLQQVLLNLTINAIQAIEGSGQVTLSTQFVAESPGQQARVEARVIDTGPGVAPEDGARIFDPFFTTKGAVGGTGLGLAISREIVLSHRGDLRVESTPGGGGCFIVSLPPCGQRPWILGTGKGAPC
jgi:two-component system NtrC family sensor kinase